MVLKAWQALLLGLVQGFTEFLPVSSSGHLVIAQSLLGIKAEMLSFDIFVHVGTLVAVFVYFWSDIRELLKRPFCRFTALLLVGCIPAGLMGVLLDDLFERLFSSLAAVACALIVTGVLLYVSDRFNGKGRIENMSFPQALAIGCFQGLAITPGLSRSGSTIFGALLCGLERSEAARFSFLLSIPVILGAALLEGVDVIKSGVPVSFSYFLGALVAAVSGYVAIRIFIRLLEHRNMRYFSYYVWALAAVVLIICLFR
ncbi:MAG: undecaprenyl-diphosphate phosphatase [Firmicutes bacterium]|nr:undecaprenyl-diphosphate phosphatase [Bacillota bacterium]MBQ6607294.1 undecaprenyl-diphosphate phosphatase [Bacillota bacterium]